MLGIGLLRDRDFMSFRCSESVVWNSKYRTFLWWGECLSFTHKTASSSLILIEDVETFASEYLLYTFNFETAVSERCSCYMVWILMCQCCSSMIYDVNKESSAGCSSATASNVMLNDLLCWSLHVKGDLCKTCQLLFRKPKAMAAFAFFFLCI